MEIDRRMVRKAISETLEDSNIRTVNPNDLLFQHTKHIHQLEAKLGAQEKLIHALEERLTFTEQLARESHTVVEQPKFQEMVDNAEKANKHSQDLVKFCIYFAKALKKK